jgi:hypothetical protein
MSGGYPLPDRSDKDWRDDSEADCDAKKSPLMVEKKQYPDKADVQTDQSY